MLPHPSGVPHLYVNRPLYGHPLIYVGNGHLFLSADQQILIEFDKSRECRHLCEKPFRFQNGNDKYIIALKALS